MTLDRRVFLQTLGAGGVAAIGAGASADGPRTTAPTSAWASRYAIDPAAPRLTPPIDVFDIVDARLAHPHPELFDAEADVFPATLDANQANHAYQAAEFAMQQGWSDEVITAAFLHDLGKAVSYEKHTWFSAEMIKPYVSEKTYWITRMHFDVGYVMYPDLHKVPDRTRWLFTDNIKDRVNLDLKAIHDHRFYEDAVKVRKADDGARAKHKRPQIAAELRKVLARTFKLSKRGLGYDGEHADELWKLMIEPCWLS